MMYINMIFQRFVALSKKTSQPAVILNQRLRFSDNKNDKNSPASEDEERQLKLKLIQLEISSLREEGGRAPNPEHINKNQWEELLQFKTKTARTKYYGFLFGIEKKKEKLLIIKQEKKQAFEEFKAKQALANSPFVSSFKNRFMLRIGGQLMNKWYHSRLARAMQYGQKLVFDCSYEAYMTRREASNAARQLMFCFTANRLHKDPFDLHFCNATPDSSTMKYLEQYMPTLRDKGFPLNLHEGSYLDLFPKEKLVYLTPHCKIDLVEYDPEDIYIIGAMVDKVNQQPLSLGKAKALGLRMARFPLDRYLNWSGGSGKSLTLDQVTKIMLDIKTTRDWANSLKHVPTRKIVSEAVPQMKIVRKWSATVDETKFVAYPQKENITMSNANTFKRKILWTKNSISDSSTRRKDDNTKSTAKDKIEWHKK